MSFPIHPCEPYDIPNSVELPAPKVHKRICTSPHRFLEISAGLEPKIFGSAI